MLGRDLELKTCYQIKENGYIDWHYSMLIPVANTVGYLPLFISPLGYSAPISKGGNMLKEDKLFTQTEKEA